MPLCARTAQLDYSSSAPGPLARSDPTAISTSFIDYDTETRIPNLFHLMQIEEEISEALGIPVTITTRNALHPSMKESIERDAVRVT
jgi:predicted nucleotidyltransferase